MKRYSFLILLPIMLFFLISCDKVNPPYMKNETTENDTASIRKIILEEFTGHQCPNCPLGNIKAQQLKSIYGEKLILISIHAGDFAEPGTGEFADDFRCPTGNELNTFFAPTFYPKGMVSRTGFPTNAAIDKDAWGTRIQTINNLAPEVKIEISNSYNSSTRTSNINLEFDALQNMTGTYKLAVYLTEDSIVSAQTTTNDPDHSDDIIHDYVH
ncbi:MAG: Omp28-related outer membrane protein, partial [Bacteroidetes bacterium]|nr:Omp28-related outer membrane protein [Bacteroidota bacterium]